VHLAALGEVARGKIERRALLLGRLCSFLALLFRLLLVLQLDEANLRIEDVLLAVEDAPL